MNTGASIRARLLNVAKQRQLNYQLVLINYFQERLLFRLSKSRYAEDFILKGGLFIYAYHKQITRPTKDADLLSTFSPLDEDKLVQIFSFIAAMKFDDGVEFDSQNISKTPINKNQQEPGLRLGITGSIDTIHQTIKIDIAFGDVIIPEPQFINYPNLLSDMEPISIKAYSIESVLAEKIHAIISLGYANSRMKDIYDVYHILEKEKYEVSILKAALEKTFNNRQSSFSIQPEIFNPEFANDTKLLNLWSQFIKRNDLDNNKSFKEYIASIKSVVLPIWNELS
jgi:predicted nucleotidyltransferase component of viral defense system